MRGGAARECVRVKTRVKTKETTSTCKQEAETTSDKRVRARKSENNNE